MDTLTLWDLRTLTEIVDAVDKHARIRWLVDEGVTAEGVVRAFTHNGGGFLTATDNVLDAYLWVSSTTEWWLPVSTIMTGLREGRVYFDL